jgi:hypothetical protein
MVSSSRRMIENPAMRKGANRINRDDFEGYGDRGVVYGNRSAGDDPTLAVNRRTNARANSGNRSQPDDLDGLPGQDVSPNDDSRYVDESMPTTANRRGAGIPVRRRAADSSPRSATGRRLPSDAVAVAQPATGDSDMEEDGPSQWRVSTHNSGANLGDSLRRSGRVEQAPFQTVSSAPEYSRLPRDPSLSPRARRPREDDRPILAAILTLLPELNIESLKVVIGNCVELAK